LAIFKYANFFLENVNALLKFVGLSTFAAPVSILLPVGISFYTFQALAYSVDVYRNEVDAQKNFLDFSLFIAFFPQLVAGPIERSRNLMPQVIRSRHVHPEMISHALLLLVWGFFKKLVIADNAGLLTY
jgi:D-alanyl-lipoteichoic acid acyltransferase DltB (MBOAT superfamily)